MLATFDFNMIKLLLEHGAEPNIQDENGDTPLHIVALVGNKESIRLLLEHGADPTIKNHLGLTPLVSALTFENTSVADFLKTMTDVNRTNLSEELNIALVQALRGDCSPISELIAYGADVNFVEKSGDSILMDVVWGNRPAWVTKDLINAGANVNFINKSGDSVLMKAIKHFGKKEIIKLLIEAGADVNYKDNSGKSVLRVALENESEQEVVALLKAAGAKK